MKKEKLNSNKDNFKDWVGGGLRGRRKERGSGYTLNAQMSKMILTSNLQQLDRFWTCTKSHCINTITGIKLGNEIVQPND